MNSTLRIFRKDVRHLWPRIVLVGAIESAAHLAASAPWLGIARLQMGLGAIEALAQWFLIASAILEEPLAGDRQYWLTRPYSWKTLLAAKLLFFLIFIHLPVLAADGSALILRGLSPMAYLPGLAIAQFFTLDRVLCGAALASMSASLVQLVWVGLAAFVGYVVTLEVLANLWGGNVAWGGVEWLHQAAMAAFWVLGAAAILAAQFVMRRTELSQRILAAGVLAMTFMMWMPGWHAAFALQSWLGPRRVADSVVRIHVDPAGALETGPLGLSFLGRASAAASAVAVEVPVLVTGIPSGMGLQSDRVAASGATPDGRVWNSAWDQINRLIQVIGDRKSNREERVLPGDGAYWLYFNVDRSLASRDRDLFGHMRATAALTLLSAEEITPLQTGSRPTRVPMGGLCWVASMHNMDVICSWPAPMPGYAVVRILSNGTPVDLDIPLSALEYGSVSYGPCSNAGGLWQVFPLGETQPEPSEIVLVTRRVVAHFERGVDIYRAGGWPLQW
jgi:hypothetical protein